VRALTHELKSPLAAIQGAAELLQEPLPDADRERFAAQVLAQSGRLNTLVEQMLELSKLESLQAPPQPQMLELGSLTESVLAEHEAALQQRGLRVVWAQREANAQVQGDAALLRLALSNVLANALQHAPSGSVLEISCVREGEAATRVWALRDHGPGVPDFALPRLGERFFTAPTAGHTQRGSGLGLAIVRQVLWLHGGTVSFANAAPGLRVSLRFPAA
jgi:two-component system, OmpR family, sensor histidine kinase CreC